VDGTDLIELGYREGPELGRTLDSLLDQWSTIRRSTRASSCWSAPGRERARAPVGPRPGPYQVAFSTRLGGVSQGPYESLNLGVLTHDDPENVRRTAAACARRSALTPTGSR
jgi:hypothetical protein